jgi:uncharacterized protein (TIGR00369 family)
MNTPITDADALKQRMATLFADVKIAGVNMSILDLSFEAGTVTLEFEVSKVVANQFGFVEGGMVATMLDGCVGMAGAIKSGGLLAMPCAELKVSFVRPVSVGKLVGRGETLRLGKSLAFLEAGLYDEAGKLLARASATAAPIPFPDMLPA